MKKIERTIEYMGRRRTALLALSAAIVLVITYLLIVPAMTALRQPIDAAEMITDKNMWPVPCYADLMFEV